MLGTYISGTWAIVLAGGDGTRLAAYTEALHGCPTPKQFAFVAAGESMVQATLRRVSRVVAPDRIVIVVGRNHLRWAHTQLCGWPEATILVQPASRGTAAAFLYALTWIRLHDPTGHVLMFPSDHHVAAVEPMVEAVRRAHRTSRTTGRVTLIGVRPDAPDPDYGWIVPGAPLHGDADGAALDRFVEKPAAPAAAALRADGALWNTFMLAGRVDELWRHARAHVPALAAGFGALDALSFAPGAPDLDELYGSLPAADLSRDVLQRADRLAVVPMIGAGWSDLGTPERVHATLQAAGAHVRDELAAAAAS